MKYKVKKRDENGKKWIRFDGIGGKQVQPDMEKEWWANKGFWLELV